MIKILIGDETIRELRDGKQVTLNDGAIILDSLLGITPNSNTKELEANLRAWAYNESTKKVGSNHYLIELLHQAADALANR